MRKIPVILAGIVMLAMAAPARARPVDMAGNAVDPDCSVGDGDGPLKNRNKD